MGVLDENAACTWNEAKMRREIVFWKIEEGSGITTIAIANMPSSNHGR